jgi:hypothetical protein
MGRLAIVAACALAGAGCAAPGSRLGRIAISGTVVGRDSGSPLSLEVTVPEDYGFSRLDLMLSEAGDGQRSSQPVTVEVVNGDFSHEFPPFVYHTTFFILPPIGPYPRHPPPPTFRLAFSDAPNEIYIVGYDKGAFRYEVYSHISRALIAREHASWVMTGGEYVKLGTDDTPVWHLRIQASRR